MPRILIPLAVTAVFVVVVAVALGGGPHPHAVPPPAIHTTKEFRTIGHVKVARPLVLPNIPAEVRKLQGAERVVAARQLVLSQNVIRFWSNHKWQLAPNHLKCKEVPWQRSCTVARASLRLHTALSAAATDRMEREIPNTGNWTRAMRYAQKPFPGTASWLSFISNRECRACYTVDGGFVCNYQGSGACGPMQFMSGTFYGHADDAKAWLSGHGYIVDPEVWDWHNALGQALTAAYMRYTGQDGCHWCL